MGKMAKAAEGIVGKTGISIPTTRTEECLHVLLVPYRDITDMVPDETE